MPLDDEAKELIKRLQDFEDRLISDKVVEESVYSSIRTLERIFGKESIFKELLDRLKTRHKVKRLDATVRRAIEQKETAIEVANAAAIFPQISVNKNSILSDFLADEGRVKAAKLREFHAFFKEHRGSLEKAFEEGDSEEVKRRLTEYIEILESEESYLKQNSERMTKDIQYAWSIHNLMGHEIAHWVHQELSKGRNIYTQSIDEAYSFALQRLMHTFDKDYVFNKEIIIKEARALYVLIVPRKHGYGEKVYKFMRPFIIFIGILILCDSIARRDNDYRNRALFLQSYSTLTLLDLYRLIELALNNLKSEELKETIKETLLKTGLSQLKKCKHLVISDIERSLERLPKFDQSELLILGGPNRREKWDSLNKGLNRILTNNVKQFAASIDLLRIMGYEKEAREYRDTYLVLLERTIHKIIEDTKDKEGEVLKQEEHIIDGVVAVIEEEEEDLVEIIKGLKF